MSHKTGEVSHHTKELKITVSVSTYAVKWSVPDKMQIPGFKYYVLYYEVVGVLHEISNISVQILSFPSLYQRLRVSGPGPSSWVESLTSPAGGKWWSLWLGVLGSFPRVHWFSFVLFPQNSPKTRRLGIRLIDYRYKPACERLVVSICGPVMDWRTAQDVICPPVAAEIVFSPPPSSPRPWRWMTNDIVLNYILYIHHLCTNLG